MSRSILRDIQALRSMTVAELRGKWEELYGEPTTARNRDYLWKRLAWRVQELEYGGLSDRVKTRIEELAPDTLPCLQKSPTKASSATRNAPEPRSTIVRDIRLPSTGTVLTRQYKGQEIRVVTLNDGFEWEGRAYRSLSAVAKAVTGQKWNGRLFFGLTKRKR